MSFIFRPGDARGSAELGGKARALAALHQRGLPIPEWFVLLPESFGASLGPDGQRAFSQAVRSGMDLEPVLGHIRPAPQVVRELLDALTGLCPAGELVAVRSSAPAEDGAKLSFAGQFDSFLFVKHEDVPAKVLAVWKSAFSERVRAYGERHQLARPSHPPAVLVQRMVHAQAAGVAFGADPVTGRRDITIVSAVHGLGTALVQGECDADSWHVDRAGKIIQSKVARKTSAHRFESGEIRRVEIPADAARSAALDGAQVRAVAELTVRAGEIFSTPQDLEWALESGRLFVLQSRPITALPSMAQPAATRKIWDNSNIIESYSGVTTPLTFSFARRAYEGVYRRFCQLLAVPAATIAEHDDTFRQMLGLIRGRVYYNLLNWYRVLALLPGFRVNRRFMEQMMGVKEELPREIIAELSRATAGDRAQDGIRLALGAAALASHHFLLPRTIRRFYARLNTALTISDAPLESRSVEGLAASYLSLEKKLLTRWDAPLINDFFAMIFFGVLRKLLQQWVHESEGTLQNSLISSEGGMISAEPARRVRELAELASKHGDFVNLLRTAPAPEIQLALDQFPEFKSAANAYLAKFGDRCLEELKLESLTLHDEPLLLWRAVGRLARAASSGAAADAPGDPRRLAEDRVTVALSGRPFRHLLLRWVLRQARARVRDRENLRFERTRVFARVRRIFVELGRRLHEGGHLQEPRDIFFLEIDEVLSFVAGVATTTNLKPLVSLRKAEFAEYRATEPPPDRFTTEALAPGSVPWLRRPSSAPEVAENQRKGTGCSPGVVRGRVRKIIDPRDGVVHAGEILVAERTDPGWVLLFASAAALLVERGSLLSHSAIVAREMRIPAIVSIQGLTAWLRDGDWVELDGSTGVVRKIEPAPSLPEQALAPPRLIESELRDIIREEAGAPALRLAK